MQFWSVNQSGMVVSILCRSQTLRLAYENALVDFDDMVNMVSVSYLPEWSAVSSLHFKAGL
jgi:hypothetical protein